MKVKIIDLLEQFNRWEPVKSSSWSLRVFKQYQTEMKRIVTAYSSTSMYTYRELGASGAVWDDIARNYMETGGDDTLVLSQWSKGLTEFDNWIRLNELMALCSYLEVYISSIVSAALESDPGLFVNSSHSVDGIKQIKNGVKFKRDVLENVLTGCTRGDWQSRINNLSAIFGNVPESLKNGLSDLEKIRMLRNKVGHAFGRDIEKSRDYEMTEISRMARLSSKTFLRYMYLVQSVVCDLDRMIMDNYIGNFQPLLFYHRIRPMIPETYNNGERMMFLKKLIGTNTKETYSKAFCRWVVEYYERL